MQVQRQFLNYISHYEAIPPVFYEEFEDTEGRPHNEQKKKDKKKHNDLQNIHIKVKND
jgi:hypothetical protein